MAVAMAMVLPLSLALALQLTVTLTLTLAVGMLNCAKLFRMPQSGTKMLSSPVFSLLSFSL